MIFFNRTNKASHYNFTFTQAYIKKITTRLVLPLFFENFVFLWLANNSLKTVNTSDLLADLVGDIGKRRR